MGVIISKNGVLGTSLLDDHQNGGLDPSLLDDPTSILGKLWYFCDLQSMGLLWTKFGE